MFKSLHWDNFAPIILMDSNLEFYQNIKISKFKEIAHLQGFDTCPDIRILYPYFKDANEILEVGTGYGRAIQGILAHGFEGNITSLDRSSKMCEYTRNFTSHNVEVLEADARDYEILNRPDVILWIWSGILEVDSEEQKQIVQKFGNALESGGLLALEIPRQIKYVGVHVGNQKIKVETEWGNLEAYLPSHQEMLDFKDTGNFKSVEVIYYQSDTGLERALYLYKK